MNIGFMQGRFVPLESNLLQSFPHKQWKIELQIANIHQFNLIEWVVDDWNNNPILTKEGGEEIQELLLKYSINIESIDAMCFMYNPFWKEHKKIERNNLIIKTFDILRKISENTSIKSITIPLVDNGSIKNHEQQQWFCDVIKDWQYLPKILIESDFYQYDLLNMLEKIDNVGITYDTGNSASMGYNASDEISVCKNYIENVHIKDRVLNGKSKILGFGDTNFQSVFRALKDIKYQGNFILQAARPVTTNLTDSLITYRKMIEIWYDEA